MLQQEEEPEPLAMEEGGVDHWGTGAKVSPPPLPRGPCIRVFGELVYSSAQQQPQSAMAPSSGALQRGSISSLFGPHEPAATPQRMQQRPVTSTLLLSELGGGSLAVYEEEDAGRAPDSLDPRSDFIVASVHPSPSPAPPPPPPPPLVRATPSQRSPPPPPKRPRLFSATSPAPPISSAVTQAVPSRAAAAFPWPAAAPLQSEGPPQRQPLPFRGASLAAGAVGAAHRENVPFPAPASQPFPCVAAPADPAPPPTATPRRVPAAAAVVAAAPRPQPAAATQPNQPKLKVRHPDLCSQTLQLSPTLASALSPSPNPNLSHSPVAKP